jgi:hypothetical protein
MSHGVCGRRRWLGIVALAALAGHGLWAPGRAATPSGEPPADEVEGVLQAVEKWAAEIGKEKNANGAAFKKLAFSRKPRKVDDATYQVAAHVNTAEETRQLTEQYRVTVKKTSGKWEIAQKEVVDSVVKLVRSSGVSCYPFQKFTFDREGLKLSATNGTICETYESGRVSAFGVHSADLAYTYKPPAHAATLGTGHDFYAMHELLTKDHTSQLVYKPAAFLFRCHLEVCEELLASSTQGAERPSAEQREGVAFDAEKVEPWAKNIVDETVKERKKDAFYGFDVPDYPGNRYWRVFIPTELQDVDDGIYLNYDNWGEWEVTFGVIPQRWDIPDQLYLDLYGYVSEKTAKELDPYQIERREGWETRWFDVESVSGEVDFAVLDPEKVQGNVEFGLKLKQDTVDLPFFIVSWNDRGPAGQDRPKPIIVNSIAVDGEEATWVQYGPISGTVVLPKPVPAGTKVTVRLDWESRTLLKLTHSYSYVPRIGWLPFVRFGDVIDSFDLTMRSPAKYDIIGIGKKVEERIEGDKRISRWSSANVNFPTVIFGTYRSDVPKFDAKKADGTVIPIRVYVDESSFGDWQIRENSLRPLAEQAANAINLYREVSGLDYPFAELNIVNDYRGGLYGQAPSSLIYLGSPVFRGEAFLAPFFVDATGIAKFLKSVVAHEVGHQWWGNTIANANGRNYWFVESLAEYFSAIFVEAVHGYKEYQWKVDDWRRNILSTDLVGSVQNASTLYSGGYQAAVYNKGPYAFHMLRETFRGSGPRGPEGADARFFAFLKQFSQELAEKRDIVTLDIQNAAEKALGGVDENGKPYNVDLDWFFDQWIRGTGTPQYAFDYDVDQSEDGSWLLEGTIRQRVLLGKTDKVLEGTVYRGVVDVVVEAKGGPYSKRIVINAAETPVLLKLPAKPLEVTLNKGHEMLARDTQYNQSW